MTPKHNGSSPGVPPLDECFARLSAGRNVSESAVREAHKRGLLTFAIHKGLLCWRFGDSRNASFRRLDGRAIGTGVKAYKADSITSGPTWNLPIGLDEVLTSDRKDVLVVEGSPDGLAALHFAEIEGTLDKVGVVVLLGEGTRIAPEEAKRFKGLRVRIFPDATKGGREAAELWADSISFYADLVTIFDLSGLTKVDGTTVKDLNDCTSISFDDFEAQPDLSCLTIVDSVGPRVSRRGRGDMVERLSLPAHRETETQRNKDTEETESLRNGEGGEVKEGSSEGNPKTGIPWEPLDAEIDRLVRWTVPSEAGRTNKCLFTLSKKIKEASKTFDPPTLKTFAAIARVWVERSNAVLPPETTAEDVAVTLRNKFSKVHSTANLFAEVLADFDSLAPFEHPDFEIGSRCERLARVCREMGNRAADGEFSLSTRQAAECVGVKQPTDGGDYIAMLEDAGVIRCTQRGKVGGMRASRFKCLPESGE